MASRYSYLPRHLQIVYDINARFLDGLRARFPGDDALVQRLSLIDEYGERSVRMAHLAFLGSRVVNGVSAMHSDLLRETVFRNSGNSGGNSGDSLLNSLSALGGKISKLSPELRNSPGGKPGTYHDNVPVGAPNNVSTSSDPLFPVIGLSPRVHDGQNL